MYEPILDHLYQALVYYTLLTIDISLYFLLGGYYVSLTLIAFTYQLTSTQAPLAIAPILAIIIEEVHLPGNSPAVTGTYLIIMLISATRIRMAFANSFLANIALFSSAMLARSILTIDTYQPKLFMPLYTGALLLVILSIEEFSRKLEN